MAEGQRHHETEQMLAPLMSRQAISYYERRLVEPVIEGAIAEMQSHRGDDV